MSSHEFIVVLRSGNRIVIDSVDERICDALSIDLRFVEQVFLRGKELYQARRNGLSHIRHDVHDCYVRDHKGRVGTAYGFLPRVKKLLLSLGFKAQLRDLDFEDNVQACERRDALFAPQWDHVYEMVTLRHRQEEFLVKVATYDCGRFDCPPGFGKTYLIGLIGLMWPKAKIGVVTRRVPVLCSRIYPELCQMLPSVGIVGGKKKILNRRVMCFTAGSLHWATQEKWDVIIFDECFPAGTFVSGKPIETIRVGDIVRSIDKNGGLAYRNVCRVFRKPASQLISIRFDSGASLVCTPNHPIWTEYGYLPAFKLCQGDGVIRLLQESEHGNRAFRSLQDLWHEVGIFGTAKFGSVSKRPDLLFAGVRASGFCVSHEIDQPVSFADSSRQDFCQHDWSRTFNSWRQWLWPDQTGKAFNKSVENARFRARFHYLYQARYPRVSYSLQNRRGESVTENCYRGGRWLSLSSEKTTTRSQEGGFFTVDRVDRIAIQEPGSDGKFGGLCPDGYVYNLEVDVNHNYFADGILVHNCHEAASDDCAMKLGLLPGRPRMYGLSATQDQRLDGKDMRVEGMFGPVRMKVTYDEGVAHEMVVPIRVKWRSVVMDVDPCGDMIDVPKKRHGIWRNEHRNQMIVEDVRRYPDKQVMISVETIEHLLYLKKLCPELTILYREEGIDRRDYEHYEQQGLIPADYQPMTLERRQALTVAAERGELRLFAVTPIFNVGVNLKQLGVVVRADAGGSPINDTQIPGRASRTSDGKDEGIVHDYLDKFNRGFYQKALGRARSYKANGWQQEVPGKGASLLRQKMFWE